MQQMAPRSRSPPRLRLREGNTARHRARAFRRSTDPESAADHAQKCLFGAVGRANEGSCDDLETVGGAEISLAAGCSSALHSNPHPHRARQQNDRYYH